MRLPGTSRITTCRNSTSTSDQFTAGASVAATALKPWQAGYTEQQKVMALNMGSAEYNSLEAARDAQSGAGGLYGGAVQVESS
jgi:hypothetical protein